MKKLLFWPYQVYVWLFLYPMVGIVTLVCGWSVVILSIATSSKFANRVIAMPWARIVAFLTPVRVKVRGLENICPDRSCVVAANHVSAFDIPALYGWLGLDLKWVIKKELRKYPGIGIGCEKAGHIFVDRQSPEAARRSVNEALAQLHEGIGILFFVEGTRSTDGRLLPFKKGAFRVAMDQQLPILPVTVNGTGEIMRSGSLTIFPGVIEVIVHPPIETRERESRDLLELMSETRAAISSGLPEALQD